MTNSAVQQFRFATIDATGADRQAYRELHNVLFPNTAMSLEWLDWYHSGIAQVSPSTGERHTSKSTRTHAVFDVASNKMVGVWSVEPKTYLDEERHPHRVGRCFAVGIHPDYRRHGLFVRLSEFAIAQERAIGEYTHIFGFPQQGRPVIGGHLKAGWDVVQNFEMYYSNTSQLREFVSLRDTSQVTDFSRIRSHDEIPCSFQNSPDYRNAKWIQHPDNHYICLSRGNSYVVLKPYDQVCHVLDLQGDLARQSDLVTLLKAAQTLARRHRWREINLWAAPQEAYLPAIHEAGYLQGSELSPAVVLLAVRVNSPQPLKLGVRAHFQMGVEEIY